MIRRGIALKLALYALPIVVVLAVVLGLIGAGATFEDDSARSGAVCGGPPAVSLGTGAIAWPMPAGSYRQSSGYGPRGGTLHRGIDLAAPIGTPYYSAGDGVVTEARAASGFGWVIVVRHTIDGQTVDTVYGHSNIGTFRVTKGQPVAAGQVLAEVGNEGQSTGPHLHFEVWPGGWNPSGSGSVDPAGWLSSNVRDGETTAPPPDRPAVSPVALPAPQGRQATMALTSHQLDNVEAIVAAAKATFPDEQTALRAAVIGVATAAQESSLVNISYGDRDSIGLFQQRAPWGTDAERMDPVTAATMFFTGGRGGQRGLTAFPDWPTVPLAVAAQRVQVSAFPDAYAKWQQLAVDAVAAASGVAPAELGAQLGAVCATPVVG